MRREKLVRSKHHLAGRIVAAAAVVVACFGAAAPALAEEQQDPEMILGLFWNSEDNLSDTLYVSCNGVEYHKIGVPFPCADGGDDTVQGTYDNQGKLVNYVHAIHDPGLFYKDGNFWAVGGYVQYQEGLGYRLTPMFASSKDLENWSFPNSGSATNLAPDALPAGSYSEGQYDTCGTEAFADDDGTVWLVTTLGYFGMNHGDDYNDTMNPYICRVDNLAPGADQASDPGAQPIADYGALTAINLPISGDNDNWLDPSLYKENGTYYLSIKKDGITNMVFSIKDLNRAGDKSAWTLVCADVVTGYEGPSLTKANGEYLMVTDKLKDYPFDSSDGTTGNFVTRSTSLTGGWHSTQRIATLGISGGETYSIANRHGSVLKVPAEATQLVKALHEKAGWDDFTESDLITFEDVDYTQWYAAGTKVCASKGIIRGYENADGTYTRFGVGNGMTRAQFATILWRIACPEEAAYYDQDGVAAPKNTTGMSDVEDGAWYTAAANWAVKNGVISGFDNHDGTYSFSPNTDISFEQMLTITANYVDKSGAEATDTSVLDRFADKDSVSSWAQSSVAWAANHDLASGYDNHDGTRSLKPQETVERQRAATVIANAFDSGVLTD